jgi:hypothetical protein
MVFKQSRNICLLIFFLCSVILLEVEIRYLSMKNKIIFFTYSTSLCKLVTFQLLTSHT